MKRIVRLFATNLPSLLLAFILSVVIWANAVREADPVENVSYQLSLEIVPRPNGLLLTTPPDTILVTLTAPQSVLAGLSPADLRAVVDLSSSRLGIVEAPVEIMGQPERAQVVSIFPDTVTVELDEEITREVPITLDLRGTVAAGHRASDPIFDPPVIQVTGPAREVSRLAEARVTIFLESTRETVVRSPRPLLYDEQGNVVSTASSDIQLSPEQTTVTIPVEQLTGFAERAVSVNWSGEPATGYRLLQVSVVEPRSVLLTGPPLTLDTIRVVETEPLNIAGLRASATFRVSLVLPSDVSLVEQRPVEVLVEIEPILTSSVVARPPEIRSLGRNLTATLSTDEVRVFLFGPLEILDTLTPEDVRVTVDLFGLDEGVYPLTPTISLPVRSVEIRSFQPARITVQISSTLTEENDLPGPETFLPGLVAAPLPGLLVLDVPPSLLPMAVAHPAWVWRGRPAPWRT